MYQFIVKPQEKKVDLQICIPVYKREIELIALVKSIRKVESILGNKEKKPNSNEIKNALLVRKSIVV